MLMHEEAFKNRFGIKTNIPCKSRLEDIEVEVKDYAVFFFISEDRSILLFTSHLIKWTLTWNCSSTTSRIILVLSSKTIW